MVFQSDVASDVYSVFNIWLRYEITMQLSLKQSCQSCSPGKRDKNSKLNFNGLQTTFG